MATFDPVDPAGIDALLTESEIAVRSSVRQLMRDRVEPYVADWFEAGHVDDIRGLVKEFGNLGLLGMHLSGYGCAGTTATEYGVACLELEAADSGIRSLVSVQGSLAMYAIWAYGSEDQKQEWLPRMAAGGGIGGLGPPRPAPPPNPSGMR